MRRTRAGLSQGEPRALRPHLVARLRAGWRVGAGAATLIAADGTRLDLRAELPRGSRVVAAVPLARARDRRSGSPAARQLARYVHVILPAGADAAKLLATVRRWPAVEEARVPPAMSLPSR